MKNDEEEEVEKEAIELPSSTPRAHLDERDNHVLALQVHGVVERRLALEREHVRIDAVREQQAHEQQAHKAVHHRLVQRSLACRVVEWVWGDFFFFFFFFFFFERLE